MMKEEAVWNKVKRHFVETLPYKVVDKQSFKEY